MQKAEFQRPGSLLLACMGVLTFGAAGAGIIAVIVLRQSLDLKTGVFLALGVAGACALGAGLINAWRTPMLTVEPDALTIPTFFGAQVISIGAGHPVGEFLGPVNRASSRKSATIEDRKPVLFYTLDAAGTLTKFASLNRNAPQLAQIRRALTDIAGLKVEILKADPNTKPSLPDATHWTNRR